MDLLQTLGNNMNPQNNNLDLLKLHSQLLWAKFKKLTNPDTEEFFNLMSIISQKLVDMSDYGHFPDWTDDYDKHCLRYFNRFKIVAKIKNEVDKINEVKPKNFVTFEIDEFSKN